MFLPEYNSTDIQKSPAKVFREATKHPVVINRQLDKGYVLMTKDRYARIVKAAEKI